MPPSSKPKQRTPSRGQGRHAFLTKRSEIKQALEDGYTAKEIWASLRKKGAMPLQYRTFMDYVNCYIKADEGNNQPQPRPATTPPQPAPKEPRREAKPRRSPITRRFQFNARGKRKEDLI